MAFNVKNDETDRLVRELMELTGESLTEAVTVSVGERLQRERSVRRKKDGAAYAEYKQAIARLQSMAVIDPRTPDEIIGYDEWGLPT